MAGRGAIGLGKRVGGRPAEAVAAEFQARTAEQLFTVLGELKGGAMKVGQALSVMEAAMPEEWAAPYRATLTKLQEAAPPLPPDRVHAVLAAELGPRWRTANFREFDDIPSAAASIGQVHKAVALDGREVAVKIQYPGAREALLSDLAQLSRVARLAAGWIPGLDIKPIMAELRSRMSEELDYHLEAAHQRAFASAFRDDPDFAIPDLVLDTPAVFVGEGLHGVPLTRTLPSCVRSSTCPATSSSVSVPSPDSMSRSPLPSMTLIDPSPDRRSSRPSTRSRVIVPSDVRAVMLLLRGTLTMRRALGEVNRPMPIIVVLPE